MARPTRARDRLAALLGRDKELDRLKNALHQAATGQGRVELVCGEPGIGKTRLLEEISDYAERCGAAVISACCVDDPGSPPYWPWSQIIRSIASAMESGLLLDTLGSGAALVVDAFPSLETSLGHSRRASSVSDTAGSARFRLFDAVARLLAARSRDGTLVLLIDDLHWADEPSLKLLVHVCGEVSRSRILLVGAYRELGFEPGHPLPAAVGALAQMRFSGRIPLHGLSEPDVTKLLAQGIGAPSAQSLAKRLYDLTDGNPLFVTQIVRLLAEEPGAETAPGGLTVAVRDVIARRLSRLSAECNAAVTWASILGNEFAASLLSEVADPQTIGDVPSAIDEAVKERIVEDARGVPGRYRFCHVLIREAILSSLQPGRRAGMDARVFQTLKELWRGDEVAHASELLVHALRGQPVLGPRPAARCALYAGETSLRAHAFEEARKHFATGLSALLDGPHDDLEAALTLGLAKARCVLDPGHESRVLLRRCFEHYEAKGDTAKMVEVLTFRYVLPESTLLPLYERTLPRVGRDSPERGRLLASYGIIKAFSTRAGSEGVSELVEALRLARLHADAWLEMRVLWLSAFAETFRVESRSHARQALLVKADELARRLGDCSDEIWIRGLMQVELLRRGRIDEAAALARRMKETAERQGDLSDRVRARGAELNIARYRAEWGRVRELCSELLDQAPPLFHADGWYVSLRCEEAYQVGDFAAGQQDLLRLVEATRAVPRVPAEIFLTCAGTITSAAKVTGDEDHLEEARGFALLILEIPESNEGKVAGAHRILGQICALRGDAVGAAAEYEYFAERLAHTSAEDRPFSDAHEVLGALAAVRGDVERAVAHYEDALMVAGLAVHERTWVEYDLSRILSRRRTPQDCERARGLLEGCLKTAESALLAPLAERTRGALATLNSSNPAPRLDGLTARETEVLALVARGLTNKEIGAKLFISAKTVDAHVRNILEKTGTANRTEAATYAIWHGAPGV